MHEFSIVENILKAAFEVADAHGGIGIRKITLEIGALRQVMPEALQFAFDAAIQETPAAGACLEWAVVPAKVLCESCGEVYSPDDPFGVCGACGKAGGRVIAGDDLVLKSVELGD